MGFQAIVVFSVLALSSYSVQSATFTIKNNCPYTIWPATLTSSGPQASTSGFELAPQASSSINAPAPWSGRIWARSYCTGSLNCVTGDCGGALSCNGVGGRPPATLIEFTLAGSDGRDFNDVSLVDGFNLPVFVAPQGGCGSTSCPVDVNAECPGELAVKDSNGGTVGCNSACLAFNQPQYCCTGDYGTPDKCQPTNYSQLFKAKCPQAYSYAYDDKSSTFTCPTGSDYAITFCP